MPTSQSPTTAGDFFSIRVDPDLRKQLEQLAKRNERTLSAEIRVALRRHIGQENPK